MAAHVGSEASTARILPFPGTSPLVRLGDDELMLLCAGGHRPAFAVLVDRHLPAIRRLCTKFLGTPAQGEEVAQEVFLELWSRANGYRGSDQLKPYVLRIARSRCLNHLRSRRRGEEALRGLETTATRSKSSIDALLDEERARRLQVALLSLPVKLREAVLLRFDQELDYRTIAQLTSAFESTVRSRVFHGLRRLNELLAEDAP